MQSTIVLLNGKAGTILDRGADRVRAEVREALSVDSDAIHMLAPDQMPEAIAQAARGDCRTIIVGGGDGSANLAIRYLSETGKQLGVLPLGTMNLLARDLGMMPDFSGALKALGRAQPISIDLGSVNGRAFHTLSGLGFFSQMARAREENRGFVLGRALSVVLAAARAFSRTGRIRVQMSIDGERRDVQALAVLVTNNRFGDNWHRVRMDEGVLGLHIVEDAGALAKIKASANLITGTWRDNPGIHSITARDVIITQSRSRRWVSTDGELLRERVPIHYAIKPRALTVLAADPIAAA